ncbi:MAG: hypothetical protein V7640_1875 [Betaproteobacteria bacterium]
MRPALQADSVAAVNHILAPAGIPRAIVEKLAAELMAIVKSREIGERFEADGAIPVGSSPQQFAAFLKSEMSKWSKVIHEANIQLEP